MDYAGSGEVEESQVFQPGGGSSQVAAPGPSAEEGIDQGGADGTGDKQRRQFRPLGKGAGEYGHGNGCEHDLQKHEGGFRGGIRCEYAPAEHQRESHQRK